LDDITTIADTKQSPKPFDHWIKLHKAN